VSRLAAIKGLELATVRTWYVADVVSKGGGGLANAREEAPFERGQCTRRVILQRSSWGRQRCREGGNLPIRGRRTVVEGLR
jgi:hypothetical protein